MRYELFYKRKGVRKARKYDLFFDALGAAIAVLESEHGELEGIKQDGEWVLKSGALNGIWCALGTVKGEYWREKEKEAQTPNQTKTEENET